ncbi:MAG: PhzF family phenazine biosynthesis protein [Gemmatimonadales bacterium]|nr:MAG: PhzF family phenazine biosynthesis protein [Gemmatimonadales bacterium]
MVEYRVVDAFTRRPFAGNPAAVVLPGAEAVALTDGERQAVAAEMNLSETAFPGEAGADGVRELRWFTPTTEVSLCGHATLAAAHALLEEGAEAPLRFTSLSGPLVVDREGSRLRLDFPADPFQETTPPVGLLDALGIDAAARFVTGTRCALVLLDDPRRVAELRPRMAELGQVSLAPGVMGVSVTAPGSWPDLPADAEPTDFVSRFFGPWVGVDEDPVTGMAHTLLGPWWAHRLGRDELRASQGGTRRGELTVRTRGDRVDLLGQAVTVARGRLRLPAPLSEKLESGF